jgi:hypothetical protein
MRALVEILISHLSAEDAERWGTRLLGEGEIERAGLPSDIRGQECPLHTSTLASTSELPCPVALCYLLGICVATSSADSRTL